MNTVLPDDRGRRGATYTLLTPANRYASRLTQLPGATVFKLATPRLFPARFGQYVVDIPVGGLDAELELELEHFLFGLAGAAEVHVVGAAYSLRDSGFVYVPAGSAVRLHVDAQQAATVMWFKRAYEPAPGVGMPQLSSGRLHDVPAQATAVAGLQRRELIDPLDAAHDFNISHMEFGPAVALAQIEIHDEEHGLYMTAGDGLYHLDGAEFQVRADDFIYMAPYCPQGFAAGPAGGSYLLYKDVYRDGF